MKTKQNNYMQEVFNKERVHGLVGISEFNTSFHFIDVLIKLKLVSDRVGNAAMEFMAWRDVNSYDENN